MPPPSRRETSHHRPAVIRTVTGARRTVQHWRDSGLDVGLVPTMGALHEGHLSLVREAQRHADKVIVSIFVNPTQFGPAEDFARYPRTFRQDRALLASLGVDAIYAPTIEQIYPAGFSTSIHPSGPALAGLEDRFRPTHFAGVATVVAKLLLQTGVDVAVFGEKDYQQLMVIRRTARDLDLAVKIIGAPTVRDADGLALSSRNRYLDPDQRRTAALLPQVLQHCAAELRAGKTWSEVHDAGVARLSAAGFHVDYLARRHAATLAEIDDATQASPAGHSGMPAPRDIRLLVAARIGATRLLDNIPLDG